MSDAHDHETGGHEIDKMPSGRLFNILGGLSIVTLGLCIGVVQMFNQQVRSIEGERAKEVTVSQQAYRAEMTAVADGYGKFEYAKKDKGDETVTSFYIPVKDARKKVLDDAKLLNGTRAGRGWKGTSTAKQIEEKWGGMPAAAPNKKKLEALKKGAKPTPADAKAPRAHNFNFAVHDGALLLAGQVPSEAVSKTIEAAARKTHFGDKVNNKLKVSGAPPKPEFAAAQKRALEVLDLMSSGNAKWAGGKLSVGGFVSDANKAKFDALSKAPGGPTMGTVEVASTELADTCDKDFSKILGRSQIRFKTGSAELTDKNTKVLDKLAKVAKRCPGTFVIEGHTDNVGDAAANKKLSTDRAKAVSAALEAAEVAKPRLRPKGFGDAKPIADNAEKAGQAKNRRIEIHIAR